MGRKESNQTNKQTNTKISGSSAATDFGGKLKRGSYISAHFLLNVLNELGESDKMRDLQYSDGV